MSVLVPEEVRRLFQVLTGEDMTDADEDALFAVAERLESGAVAVEVLGPVVGEVVGRVRGGFSGKAADRFADRLAGFVPVLESGGVGLRELAGFVRNLALQVQYLKFVTVGGLVLLVAEVAWAVAMAGPTGGASMAWLAARFAVMRLVLSRWWGQLFMRLAMAQIVGIGLQVVIDGGAQGVQFALGTRKKWDGDLTTMAVGVGAFTGLLVVPLSALGNVVGNAVTKVLVRGLGDGIDVEVLAAAARQVAEKHAQQYSVASIARFADVVSKNLDDYTGMSVRAMWAARFGHGLGESLEEGLTEMLGEAGYGAISGQGAQWNPFSFTAGLSEAVGSGMGKLTGLAVRGELTPAGRARDAGGEKDPGSTESDTSEELKSDSGSQLREKPGAPSSATDVHVTKQLPSSEAVTTDLKPGPGSIGTGPDSLRDQDRPGTPPPQYSPPQGDEIFRSDALSSDGTTGAADSRVGMPPAYSPITGDDHAGFASSDAQSTGRSGTGQHRGGSLVSDGAATWGESGASTPSAPSPDVAGNPDLTSAVDGTGASVARSAPESVPGSPNPVHSASTGSAAKGGDPDLDSPSNDEVVSASYSEAMLPGQEAAWDGATKWAGSGLDVLARSSTTVPAGASEGAGAETADRGVVPEWTAPDLRREVQWARSVGGPRAAAVQIVQGTHDVVALAREDAEVSLDDVVALVAAKVDEVGRAAAVRFSLELAARLDTRGTGLGVRAGAEPSFPDEIAVFEDSTGSGQAAGVIGESADDPLPPGPEPTAESALDGMDVGGLGPADGAGLGSAEWAESVPESGFPILPEIAGAGGFGEVGADGGLSGIEPWSWGVDEMPGSGGLDLAAGAGDVNLVELEFFDFDVGVAELDNGAVDALAEGAATALWAESVPESGFPILPEIAGAGGFGEVGADGGLSGIEPWSWGVDEMPGSGGLDLAAGVGDVNLVGLEFFDFDVGVTELDNGAVDALAEGAGNSRRFEREPEAKRVQEAARVEARRARDAGEPYIALALGQKFGKSKEWGRLRLGEIRDEGGATSLASRGQELADVREAARVEARRARDAGEPYTGAALGQKFGKSTAWGQQRLVEIRDEGGATSSAVREREVERFREVERLREAARVEARRARDAGEPYTGAALGQKFGKSTTWGQQRLAEIRIEGGARRSDSLERGLDSRSAALVFGESVGSGEVGSAADDSSWAVGDSGGGGLGSIAVSSGRKRGRDEDSGDEGAGRRPVGRVGGAVDRAAEVVNAAGVFDGVGLGSAEVVDEVAGAEGWWARGGVSAEGAVSADLFDVEWAESGGEEGFAVMPEFVGADDRGVGAWGSFVEGAEVLPVGSGDEAADSDLGAVEEVGRPGRAELVNEAARVEARRARDAGEPYSGAELGKKFGRSTSWGHQRLGEIRDEGGATSSAVRERLREAARVEARRARDAGEPYTGAALGKKFGKSESWGKARIAEITSGVAQRALRENELELAREREAGRAEARRARDAGEPYTAAELGEKFGKSKAWGGRLLAEIRAEGGATSSAVREREGDRLREAARVEACRARDAGEPYTGAALGEKFGKSKAWGQHRLGEIRDEGGATSSALRGQEWADARVAARVEARRARDAGEPYTAAALGEKFGKSVVWGWRRLAEIRIEGGARRSDSLERGLDSRSAALVFGESVGSGEVGSAADDSADLSDVESAESGGEEGFAVMPEFVGADDRGVGAWGSFVEGAEVLPVGSGDEAADSDLGAVEEVGRPGSAELVNESALVEARRARDAGEPYTGAALGEKFGMSSAWGKARIAEIRGGVAQRALRGNELELAREREAGRAEACRARDAGEPYTGAALGEKFGKSTAWGEHRLGEIRDEGGATSSALRGQEWADARVAALVEARRARDAGETYTAAALGEKFGKSTAWGQQRLVEIRDEDGATSSAVRQRAGERLREAALVEARRARDAGEPYTAAALGKKFGKSTAWGQQRLAQIRDEGGARQSDSQERGLDSRSAALVFEESVGSGEVGGAAAEPADDSSWHFDLASGLWSFGAAVGDSGGGGLGSIAVSSGRKRGRDEDSGDEGARRRPVGPVGGAVDRAAEVVNAAEVLDGVGLGSAEVVDEVDRGVGAWGSFVEGAEVLPVGSGDEAADSDLGAVEEVGRPGRAELVNEAARVEARRARDAGEPYSGAALGKKFGKSKFWGRLRLGEIRDEGGATSSAVREREVERLREAARMEARRARDAGKPYTGAALGEKFGKRSGWGNHRLAEIRAEGGATSSTVQARADVREAARVEARRARDAGEPYTGAALGEKFGKSKFWGQLRLAEIRSGVAQRALRGNEPELAREREAGRAEALRARDAGEPYTAAELGKKFGKSKAWGWRLLAEIRAEGGATSSTVQARADVREAARVEALRARDAGEPYTGAALGKKFGRSSAWGKIRLAEIKNQGGATRSDLQGQERADVREAARVEARRARDAGEPYTVTGLGKKFGKSAAWGSLRLQEIRNEAGSSAGEASGAAGGVDEITERFPRRSRRGGGGDFA
ncbi:WXG100-like domain-containing protein [Saccharopolyspora phatthalungensis]|uniref:Outer membrane channel protein CpnT-like N-terminal domain-containing protein n=1 Tax=Saccharopolyspora phatthalungensis TaxID=664693 RepID=A0A840Q7I1_9PSEU|nr:hypothetical protein [Saccharopolyspora phatthalungensis]MBB5158472.1 hypothetical protein [Saccharopolyspora phatthalungensis]